MLKEDELLPHGIALNQRILRVKKKFPRRFVFLVDVYEHVSNEEHLMNMLHLNPSQALQVIDYELGAIYDPWASVLKVNFRSIPLYEATLNGYRRYKK